MASVVNQVFRHLSDDVLVQIARQIGASDANTVKRAAQGATELLVDAMAREAKTNGGGLFGAIEKDHDGGILGDLMGVLSGKSNVSNKTNDGAGILNHLLGNKQLEAAQVISQMSGLNFFKSGVLMQLIAPIVMGVVGKQQKSSNLNLGGLMDILSGGQNKSTSTPGGGLLGKILDRNNDGNMMDDLLNIGMQILKK